MGIGTGETLSLVWKIKEGVLEEIRSLLKPKYERSCSPSKGREWGGPARVCVVAGNSM